MQVHGVRQIVYFVEDPAASAEWYARQLELEPACLHVLNGFAWIEVAGIELGFHPADPDRNPVSGSPVVYWRVPDLDRARRDLLEAGCQPWRGPLTIGPGRRICQIRDPFGVVLGLDGP